MFWIVSDFWWLQTKPYIIEKTCTAILHIRCVQHLFLTSRFCDIFEVPLASLEDIFCNKYSFRDFESLYDLNTYIILSVDWKKQLSIARLIEL